jgi:hypothetical protein
MRFFDNLLDVADLFLMAVAIFASIPSQANAEDVRQLNAELVAAVCPGIGLPGIKLGEPATAQDQKFVAQINRLPEEFLPFSDADLEFTTWSDKLAGITYIGASPDGEVNRAWAKALEISLVAAGWSASNRSDLASPLTFNARYFEKTVDSSEGKRTIFLEYDTPGALMLRCGDLALLELMADETAGNLAPGSKRPEMPVMDMAQTVLPNAQQCKNPALLEAFAKPGFVDENVTALRELAASGGALREYSRHSERVAEWLEWRLLGSGLVSRERIWALEDQVAPHRSEERLESSMFVFEALLPFLANDNENHDPQAACRSFIDVIVNTMRQEQSDAEYNAKRIAILENEAERVGVDVNSSAP